MDVLNSVCALQVLVLASKVQNEKKEDIECNTEWKTIQDYCLGENTVHTCGKEPSLVNGKSGRSHLFTLIGLLKS